MKSLLKLATCVAALAGAAACGEDRGSDGLSSEEREKLNALAESQDIDTSPDSLVSNDEWTAAETGEAAAGNESESNAQ